MKMGRYILLLAVVVVFSLEEGFGQGGNENFITLGPVESGRKIYQSRRGPWGSLEYYYTYLEAPDSVMEYVNTPSSRTVWNFPGRTAGDVREILRKAGLLEADIENLFEISLPLNFGENLTLYPPDALVANLAPESRSALYRELRLYGSNPHHRAPLVIESGEVSDWFADSRLSAETIALIDKMSYPFGGGIAFSDVPYVISRMRENDREERTFLKAMTRTRTLMVRIRIDESSDLDQLKSYWSVGHKRKDILPFLEAAAQGAGLGSLDIVHLLPPTPRQYLYTYPGISAGLDGSFPDSFWASLNFFEYIPREEFKDAVEASVYANAFYEPATEPPQFGDLLIISDARSGKAIQSATFLADDIVYTKIGRSVFRPFVLTKWDDLLSRYREGTRVSVHAWRQRTR